MATFSHEPKATECSICHDTFREPKILPCAHIMCCDCLVSWLKSGNTPQCPLCKCNMQNDTDSKDIDIQTLVDNLPLDTAMVALVESGKFFEKDHMCCVCGGVAALTLCLDCSDMLCPSCVKVHGKLSVSRHHMIKNLDDLTLETLVSNRPVYCLQHPSEPSKLFCTSHNIPICHLCSASAHRTCHEVKDLSTHPKEAQMSLQELDNTLITMEASLRDRLSKCEQQLVQTDKDMVEAQSEVHSTCNRLTRTLDASVKGLNGWIPDFYGKQRNDVNDRKRQLELALGHVTSHQRLVKRVNDTASATTILQMLTMLKARVEGFKVNIEEGQKVYASGAVKFDPKIIAHIEHQLQDLENLFVRDIQATGSAKNRPSSALKGILQFLPRKLKVLRFSNGNQTAEYISRMKQTRSSLQLKSCETMKIDLLYEVRIEVMSRECGCISAGVYRENPMAASNQDISLDWPSSIMIMDKGITFSKENQIRNAHLECHKLSPRNRQSLTMKVEVGIGSGRIVITNITNSASINCNYGKELANLKEGCRVGVLVDSDYNLHLYVNGVDQGVACRGVPQPCLAVVSILPGMKITGLPISTIE